MNVSSTFNSGLMGFHKANESLNNNATTVARASAGLNENEDLTTALVEMEGDKVAAQANLKSISAATEMVGTLIDMKV